MPDRVTVNVARHGEETAVLPHQLSPGESPGLTAVHSPIMGAIGAGSPKILVQKVQKRDRVDGIDG